MVFYVILVYFGGVTAPKRGQSPIKLENDLEVLFLSKSIH